MRISPTSKPKELIPFVHKALRAWNTIGGTDENLMGFLLLVKDRRAAVASDSNPTALRLATNQLLLDGIEELAKQDAEGARVLRDRFPNNHAIAKVARKLNMSADQVNHRQRGAISSLSRILLGREIQFRQEHAQFLEDQLPPPTYTRLLGLEDARARLVKQLLLQETPWVVGIVGIGGIGKTALADAVARQIIHEFTFEKIIWLRVEARTMSGISRAPNLTFDSLMTQLAARLLPEEGASGERAVQARQILKAVPHLIVIDNLETEADIFYLLEHIRGLAVPSKILLTSRIRPPGQAGVFTFPIEELGTADAAALIHHHASTTGVMDLANAPEEDVTTIYQATGGNPLAIKLVVSLAAILPLPQILADLVHTRPGKVEDMYRHIYWQTWQILSPEARMLLQVMPLVAETGALSEQIQAISGLSTAQLWPAVEELAARSMLEVRGTSRERRYGIHRLTETFLRTEIIHWPEDEI
ncbi:MAG: NB-ARC domain-containing protein [Anaerolineales bacterium]